MGQFLVWWIPAWYNEHGWYDLGEKIISRRGLASARSQFEKIKEKFPGASLEFWEGDDEKPLALLFIPAKPQDEDDIKRRITRGKQNYVILYDEAD